MNYYKATEAILYTFKGLKAKIENINLRIEQIRNDYTGCGAISYEERSAPTNKFNSSVENEIASKEKQIEQLERIKKDMLIDQQIIENALNTLDKRSYEIIKLRYFDKMSNQQVAIRLNLTEQRVSEIKSEIINKSLIDLIFINRFK